MQQLLALGVQGRADQQEGPGERERDLEGNLRIEKKYKQRLKSHDINLLEMKMDHDFRGRVAKIEVNQPIQDRSQHDCIEE